MVRNPGCPSKHWARWIPTPATRAAELALHQNILTAGICLVAECARNKQGAHLRLLALPNTTSDAPFCANTRFSAAPLAQAQRRRGRMAAEGPHARWFTQQVKEGRWERSDLKLKGRSRAVPEKRGALPCQRTALPLTPRPHRCACFQAAGAGARARAVLAVRGGALASTWGKNDTGVSGVEREEELSIRS